MSQELYKEALADAKKVTEIAENSAKNVVLKAMIPKIKDLIEQQLMGDDLLHDDHDVYGDEEEDFMSDDLDAPDIIVAPDVNVATADSLSLPDEEGKVTLDLDNLGVDELVVDEDEGLVDPFRSEDEVLAADDEYELNFESTKALSALKNNAINKKIKFVESFVKKVNESTKNNFNLTKVIKHVESMYEYIQATDINNKQLIEQKLETLYDKLNKLQETNVSKRNKRANRLNEEDELQLDDEMATSGEEDLDLDVEEGDADGDNELTLTLTGLPDDLDLDGLGVDLEVDDSEEGGEEDVDLEMDDSEGDDDFDMEDADADEDADVEMDDEDSEDVQLESLLSLPDDTVIEINENMLKREVKRLSRLSESPDDAMMEMDEPEEDAEDLEEGEYVDESDCSEVSEAIVQLERKLRSLRTRARTVLESKASPRRKAKMTSLRNRITEASTKMNKLSNVKSRLLKESARRNRTNVVPRNRRRNRTNTVSRQRQGAAARNLRNKLSESNLINVKLMFANKVLQSSLTKSQKAQAIDKLDECQSRVQASNVFKAVKRAVLKNKRNAKPVNESVKRGSGSSVMRRGSVQTVNEGIETNRWAKLAGIITD